jgi:flagellar basal-body rod protein FlgF
VSQVENVMQSGIYIGLTSQLALKRSIDVIANNVANVGTVGYRADNARFEELVVKSADQSTSCPIQADGDVSLETGAILKTGSPLDLAIIGDGWLAVEKPDGRAFTRDGRLVVSPEWRLTTLSGDSILDAGGAPIMVDPAGMDIRISRDGMIFQNGAQIAAVGLFRIGDPATIRRSEGASVMVDGGTDPILDFTKDGFIQGAIEQSNVNPVAELTKLIMTQRLFESVNGFLNTTEESLLDTVRMLGPGPR